MTHRTATLEFDEENFKGKIAVYSNCSTIDPGYITRAGPPFEDWTGLFKVGKTIGYRVAIQFSEKTLTPTSVFITKNPNNVEASHEVQSIVINAIRKKLAIFLNKKVSTIRIKERAPRLARNLMKKTLKTRKLDEKIR